MDIETLKTLYKVTFTQEEMYEIMMAAHHYIMREHPEFGEMFEKPNIDIWVDVIPPDDYC